MEAAVSAIMDIGRGPSTYEVEGPLSSVVRGSPITQPALRGPTSRPALSSPITQSASAVRSADPRGGPIPQPADFYGTRQRRSGKSGRTSVDTMPASPRRRLTSGATRQLVDHSRTSPPPARLRERPALAARRPWVSPGSGHHLWWRARFLPPPSPPRKSLENTISGFFTHPQNRPRYPQAETSYPPVVHRFIHTHEPRRAGNNHQRQRDYEHPPRLDREGFCRHRCHFASRCRRPVPDIPGGCVVVLLTTRHPANGNR